MKPKILIYWSRRDFRLTDNPALHKAIEQSRSTQIALLPMFIVESYMTAGDPQFQFGYPSQYFLAQAIPIFGSQFQIFSIFAGTVTDVFNDLNKTFDLEIFVNDDIHPDFYKQILKLQGSGFKVNLYNDQLTIEKSTISGTGNFYSVFTPFKKSVWQKFLNYPEVAASDPRQALDLTSTDLSKIRNRKNYLSPTTKPNLYSTDQILSLFSGNRSIKVGGHIIDLNQLTHRPDLSRWYWSESQALQRFDAYLESELLADYDQNRNSLEDDTATKVFENVTINGRTSKMSLALAWGLVSAR